MIAKKYNDIISAETSKINDIPLHDPMESLLSEMHATLSGKFNSSLSWHKKKYVKEFYNRISLYNKETHTHIELYKNKQIIFRKTGYLFTYLEIGNKKSSCINVATWYKTTTACGAFESLSSFMIAINQESRNHRIALTEIQVSFLPRTQNHIKMTKRHVSYWPKYSRTMVFTKK
ncbi:hypothetical protein K501DRAFT_272989 [Backusella circina FSU 941]|nr:hypothetical protein K501DRAFT_272989 [Backusella circina FSU 941]